MLLSFLVSALMLILFVLSYYLIVYDPDVDPWRKNDEPFRLLKYPNPVDRAFLYVVRKLFSKTCLGVAMTNSRFAKNGVLENALVEVGEQEYRPFCSLFLSGALTPFLSTVR